MIKLPYGPMYRWHYYATCPHKLVRELTKQVQYMYQRVRYGYAECDVWSIDGYIAGWLPEALRTLRTRNMGHPSTLTDKQWTSILAEMEHGFRSANEILDTLPRGKRYRELKKDFNKGMKLFHKHFFDLWD